MKRINKHNKRVLLVIKLFCLSLLFLSLFTRQLSNYTIIPMQNGINIIGTWIYKEKSNYIEKKNLIIENKKLKERVESLTLENRFLYQNKFTLERLRILKELDKVYPDYDKVGAVVIYKDPQSTLYNTFKINKGSRDGIEVNMNVLADGGLAGIVTKTGTNWSLVRTIIDDDINVSAMDLSTSDNCITMGNTMLMKNNGVISFKGLNANSNIKEGDTIVTSDISSKYLKGIIIGHVSDVTPDTNKVTFSGQLIPAVNFNNICEVLVIKSLKSVQ